MIEAVQNKVDQIVKVWNKPDDPKWKKIGNQLIFIADPVGTLLILIFVPPGLKAASVAVWNAFCIVAKALTKLTTK